LISEGGFFFHEASSSKMRPIRISPSRATAFLATVASQKR